MSLRTAFFILILMCIRYFGFGIITVKELSVSMQNETAAMEWITSAELNNKKFIIERSSDCVHFYSIGTIKGETNSTIEKKYCFFDNQPLKGVSYYRIISVDVQEHTETFPVQVLDNRLQTISNTVYPCPFKQEITIKLNAEELPNNSQVVIYGNSGRELYSCEASEEVKVDLSYLKKGTYYVTVQNNGKRLMEKKVLKDED